MSDKYKLTAFSNGKYIVYPYKRFRRSKILSLIQVIYPNMKERQYPIYLDGDEYQIYETPYILNSVQAGKPSFQYGLAEIIRNY